MNSLFLDKKFFGTIWHNESYSTVLRGQSFFVSLLEVGFSAAQTQALFDKLQILNF
jgi:hypothetical protein